MSFLVQNGAKKVKKKWSHSTATFSPCIILRWETQVFERKNRCPCIWKLKYKLLYAETHYTIEWWQLWKFISYCRRKSLVYIFIQLIILKRSLVSCRTFWFGIVKKAALCPIFHSLTTINQTVIQEMKNQFWGCLY